MPFQDFRASRKCSRTWDSRSTRRTCSRTSPKCLTLREEFVAALTEGTNLALAVNTEKAKSEFIIAPLLLELRRSMGDRFGLFSGVELAVDPGRGLNGVCDFIITKSARQFILSSPLIAIVEAKNDNLRSGLGQCIASMFASQIFNQQSSDPIEAVFGVVTTGSAWKFLRLQQAVVTLDVKEYYIDNAGKILRMTVSQPRDHASHRTRPDVRASESSRLVRRSRPPSEFATHREASPTC